MPGAASPARRLAYRVVRRVSDGAYADRALRAEADRARVNGHDRAFAQQLAYGTIQRRLTLDYVLAALSERPLDQLDPPLLDALRIGVYQLLFMGSVPDHAAVAESVELAKDARGGAHRMANAVLRRAAREGPALLAQLSDDTPDGAAILHSHPEWIVRMWWDLLGRDATVALLERDNEPAEDAVRVNTLVATRDDVRDALAAADVDCEAVADVPEALVLRSPFDVEGSELFGSGAITPQSRASMLPARMLGPEPGDTILDLCAAPGTKTTQLAALTGDRGRIVAVELNPARADALRDNCERMRVRSVEVLVEDARAMTGTLDRVLLDAPCSNLGTLSGRPDARWRKTPEQVADLAALQAGLLDAAAGCVRPGGTLVYSVCTISPSETDGQIAGLLGRRPDLSPAASRQTLPHRDGTDGFFIARLDRDAA
ncbi:MAG: 16S rRNA (cytosine(967)-C(5))-methyltransferase RsmB [Thermoleophilaceae bacterium]